MNMKDKVKKAMDSGSLRLPAEEKVEIVKNSFDKYAVDVYKNKEGMYILVVIGYNEDGDTEVVNKLTLADNRVTAMRRFNAIASDKIIQEVSLNEEYLKGV